MNHPSNFLAPVGSTKWFPKDGDLHFIGISSLSIRALTCFDPRGGAHHFMCAHPLDLKCLQHIWNLHVVGGSVNHLPLQTGSSPENPKQAYTSWISITVNVVLLLSIGGVSDYCMFPLCQSSKKPTFPAKSWILVSSRVCPYYQRLQWFFYKMVVPILLKMMAVLALQNGSSPEKTKNTCTSWISIVVNMVLLVSIGVVVSDCMFPLCKSSKNNLSGRIPVSWFQALIVPYCFLLCKSFKKISFSCQILDSWFQAVFAPYYFLYVKPPPPPKKKKNPARSRFVGFKRCLSLSTISICI